MLSVNNLSKKFKSKQVIQNISFNVSNGEVVGLIGKNGAGKTTTFHSILNFIDYDGSIRWNNKPITTSTFNEIGYLPEERSLLPDLTVEQHIIYLANLKNMSTTSIKPLINKWMHKLHITGKATDKIKNLSKGNQQKVQIICSLIHDPHLIILDEPFGGLDPVNADLLKDVILELKAKGSAIIFSSHNMFNVESICNEVVMLNEGKKVLDGSIDQIKETFGKTELYLETELEKKTLEKLPGVIGVEKLSEKNRYLLSLSNSKYGKIIYDKVTNGEYVSMFYQTAPSLDKIFRMKASDNYE